MTPDGPPPPAGLLRGTATPLVIGHRGSSATEPENTMPSFRACWSAGVDWIETDVQPAADGVPVLFHDDTLDRTTDGSGPLRDRTAADLAGLDAGSWFAGHATGIPTLADLLIALPPDGRVLLEIKGPHTDAELDTLLAVIAGSGAADRVRLQSFEVDVLQRLRAADPDVWLGLLREDLDDDPVTLCRELRMSSYHPEATALLAAPALVGTLHAAGLSVVVWTSNDATEWDVLTVLGVDGIITDRPGELRDRLPT